MLAAIDWDPEMRIENLVSRSDGYIAESNGGGHLWNFDLESEARTGEDLGSFS
jgi:hypothetical protein